MCDDRRNSRSCIYVCLIHGHANQRCAFCEIENVIFLQCTDENCPRHMNFGLEASKNDRAGVASKKLTFSLLYFTLLYFIL